MRLPIGLYFVAGIYLFARGIFALFGQTLFYTRRSLEQIAPENLSAYLREIGICQMAAGALFVGKSVLDVAFPGSRPISVVFVILLVICLIFLVRTNEKFIKK